MNTTKRVLVTGSSRGIGSAIAKHLAAEGYDILLHCRSQREQAEAARAGGGSAKPYTATGRQGQYCSI